MNEMWEDPIVSEVRTVRQSHAAKFNYDLEAIYRDLKQQEEKSGRLFVSLPPRRTRPDEEVVTAHETLTHRM
jgi:hypothetical protein